MSAPGWYPDPAGAPGQFRYWDGQSWSPNTSATPGDPEFQPEPSRGRGTLIALIATVGLVTAAIVVWLVFFRSGPVITQSDNNSTRPTVSGWDEQEPTKQPEIEVPEGGTLVTCPRKGSRSTSQSANNDWISGGGLKFKALPGWGTDPSLQLGWIYDMSVQTETVYPGWFSMVAVGEIKASDGFKEPKLSAFQIMSCFATSSLYSGYTGRNILTSEQVTIGGKPGWRLQAEVLVSEDRLPQVKGDIVDIVVVDDDRSDSLAIYTSTVTIGDNPRIDLVDAAYKSLTTSR